MSCCSFLTSCFRSASSRPPSTPFTSEVKDTSHGNSCTLPRDIQYMVSFMPGQDFDTRSLQGRVSRSPSSSMLINRPLNNVQVQLSPFNLVGWESPDISPIMQPQYAFAQDTLDFSDSDDDLPFGRFSLEASHPQVDLAYRSSSTILGMMHESRGIECLDMITDCD